MSCEPPAFLALPGGGRLAYRVTPGAEPAVVFLGGFTSDMNGTKALALEAHCRARGAAFVRFDYQGHGASGGRFEEGTIGGWAADAVAVLDAAVPGRAVLVGSSMGGWLMVLVALARPDRVAGLVGVAAAPDFVDDLLLPRLGEAGRRELARAGVVGVPNPYGDAPTPIGQAFVADAARRRVLGAPIALACPVRLLHGLADAEVPWTQSVRLAEGLAGPDVLVTLVKGGDHRLSEPADLARLCRTVDEVRARAENSRQPCGSDGGTP